MYETFDCKPIEVRKVSMNENILLANKGSVKLEDRRKFSQISSACKSQKYMPMFKNSLPKAVKVKKHYGKYVEHRRSTSKNIRMSSRKREAYQKLVKGALNLNETK